MPHNDRVMKFTLTFDMDNDAFMEGNANREVARILRKVAQDMDRYPADLSNEKFAVRDLNGNKVGTYEVTEL